MKYLKKFNESVNDKIDFFAALDDFHEENDIDHTCHTTLDDFASYLSDKYNNEDTDIEDTPKPTHRPNYSDEALERARKGIFGGN